MIDILKTKIHVLTNHMQLVISYLEREEYKKALVACRAAIKELHDLAAGLTHLLKLPKGSTVTVPKGTRVKHDGRIGELTVSKKEKL